MNSEIITCPKCKAEYDVNYGDSYAINEGHIVSQTACKCEKKIVKINGTKLLDHAMLKLKKGIKNGKA